MSLDETVKQYESVDILDILRVLPHRYPFLLVDRIINIKGFESCIGIKNVTINELHFSGHFPEEPIMPGVLIVEGMAQTAGAMYLFANTAADDSKKKKVYFLGIDKARFRKPVRPGDSLEYHITLLQHRAGICRYSGVAMVSGACVAESEFSAMVGLK